METENFGTIVSHHKALKFLLMDWKVACFDVEISPSGEAKHIFTLSVPSHTISIGFLMGTWNRLLNQHAINN